MKNYRTIGAKLFTVGVLTGLGMTACQDGSTESDTLGVSIPSSELWEKDTFKICWMNTHDSQAKERQAVEDFVVKNFDRTVLTIQPSWQSCQDVEDYDISLVFFDDPDFIADTSRDAKQVKSDPNYAGNAGNPRVRDWGRGLKSKPYGVVLNTTAYGRDDDGKKRWEKLEPKGRWNYMLTTGLHELGHAIGLRHEHAHPNSTCHDFPEPLLSGKVVSPFDAQSVMNYCAISESREENAYTEELNDAPFGFSAGDIETIKLLYASEEEEE